MLPTGTQSTTVNMSLPEDELVSLSGNSYQKTMGNALINSANTFYLPVFQQ